MSTTRRDEQGRILPREEGDPEATREVGGFGRVAPDEIEEAVRRRDEIFAEQGLNRKQQFWRMMTEGELARDLYERFQKFKASMDHTMWPQLKEQELGLPEHELFLKVLREVEADQRQKEAEQRQKREAALKNLEQAKVAARCVHIHLDGTQCGCPKMKDSELCYIHDKLEKSKSAKLDLGPMDDPDSIQVGIAKLQSAVIDGVLEPMQVRQLAYLIQLAAWNVKSTTIVGQRWGEE
ncbi:MAG TPA: hypothetical protein VHN74_13360 [Candidatus Angelobacter sp.]|jgi:hypothetical protein|nr:hypothetical protein [Candidatus Angelobacter sp.]